MTQEELASRAGVAASTLIRIESGEAKRPRVGTLSRLSEVLGIGPEELAGEARPEETPGAGPFTAVYQRDGEWWVGYVEELPGANAQGETLAECRESLREAVSLVLEANRELTRTEFGGREVVREPLRV